METLRCWEVHKCTRNECPAYRSDNQACWLIPGTCCRDEIQEKFIDKLNLCLDCAVFQKNIAHNHLTQTFHLIKTQLNSYKQSIESRDSQLENISMEMAIGLTEVFDALKKISAGYQPVRVDEGSDLEIIRKLKRVLNGTASDIRMFIDEFHEIAVGLAEHFDVLQRVSRGDLDARVTGNSSEELLVLLKKITNTMIESIQDEIDKRKNTEKKLRKNERHYKQMFNQMISGFAVHEIICDNHNKPVDYRFIDVNPAFEKLTGIGRADVVGKRVLEVMPGTEQYWIETYGKVALTGEPVIFENYSGELKKLFHVVAFSPDVGQFAVSFTDITNRSIFEQMIDNLRRQNELILNSVWEGILGLDSEGRHTFINPSAARMLGYEPEELIGKHSHVIWHHTKEDGTSYPEEECPIYMACTSADEYSVREDIFWRRDGTSFPVSYTSSSIMENGKVVGAVVTFRDITSRKQAEEKIKSSLKEKELLLREIHHRVKNNLQILTSLISFQIKEDNEARVNQILTECKDRIKTIAIIHEKLYQANDFSSIDVRKLISDIAHSLVYSLRDAGNCANLILNVQDMTVGIDLAIPLGLIVNEIVSNSIKHAFHSDMNGEIRIDFHASDDECMLSIQDNGAGLPKGFNVEKSESLGMYLIYALGEQLGGIVDITSNKGTTVRIRFKR